MPKIKIDPVLRASRINWSSGFETQVESVLEDIRMSEEQRRDVEIIQDKLERAVHTKWPDAVISKYGSVITGLSLNCSDIDFSIDSQEVNTTPSYLTTITTLFSDTEDFEHPKSHEYPFPLVSVVYLPTNTYFDITFNNDRARATTALISKIMKMDETVAKLTMLVKFWCKAHGLVKRKRLTSMAVYMLVTFYLQQECVIPSVASMMDTVNTSYVEGYNVALKSDLFEVIQEKSILQLLGGFFEYYEKFSWCGKVVSTFAGKVYEKSQFENGGNNLSDIFKDFKSDATNSLPSDSIMNVQNPLFHSQRLTGNVTVDFLDEFKRDLGEAATFYRAGVSNNHKKFLKEILIVPIKL